MHSRSPASSKSPPVRKRCEKEEERPEETEPHTSAITISILITSDGLRTVWESNVKVTIHTWSSI